MGRKTNSNLFNRVVLLVAIVLALMIVQVVWLVHSIRAQRAEILETVSQASEAMVDELEEDYYCFTLNTEAQIPKGGSFALNVPQGLSVDSLYKLEMIPEVFRNREPDTSFKELNFSVPADVLIDLHFELRASNVGADSSALSQREKNILQTYKRCILYNGFRWIDTVTFNEAFAEFKKKVGTQAKTKVGVFSADSMIYTLDGLYADPDVSTSRIMFSSIPFLPDLRVEFQAINAVPFYKQSPFWILMLALLLVIILVVLAQSFVKTIKSEKKLSEMKNELISNITHEFNTPVTNIALALRNLNASNEKEKLAIDIIAEENRRISRNIDWIMAPGSVEDLLDAEQTSEIDIHDIIELSVEHMHLLVKERNGQLHIDLQAEKFCIKGDESHLINAISNVLDNALKYSPQTVDISVRTYNKGSKIYVEIADKGIGMDSDTLDHIFKRFYRVNNKLKHDVKGFGLGLYFASKVARLYGGQLSAKSQKGEGSIFTFSFTTCEC